MNEEDVIAPEALANHLANRDAILRVVRRHAGLSADTPLTLGDALPLSIIGGAKNADEVCARLARLLTQLKGVTDFDVSEEIRVIESILALDRGED